MWADLSVAAIKGQDQQVEYVLGMLVDITERKSSERALMESEQRSQSLYTLLRMVARQRARHDLGQRCGQALPVCQPGGL
ncbi:MAG: hypothetical protein IPJ18_18275 [Betaproteobacteria bacterium]|nr:hypothetical protein [Betaproteobacteria bacterium]